MAETVNDYNQITDEEIAAGQPLTTGLMTKNRDNPRAAMADLGTPPDNYKVDADTRITTAKTDTSLVFRPDGLGQAVFSGRTPYTPLTNGNFNGGVTSTTIDTFTHDYCVAVSSDATVAVNAIGIWISPKYQHTIKYTIQAYEAPAPSAGFLYANVTGNLYASVTTKILTNKISDEITGNSATLEVGKVFCDFGTDLTFEAHKCYWFRITFSGSAFGGGAGTDHGQAYFKDTISDEMSSFKATTANANIPTLVSGNRVASAVPLVEVFYS